MRKISLAQKKINIITAVGVLVLCMLWGLLYLPSKKAVNELKSELSGIQEQIRQIEGKAAGSGGTGRGIMGLEERYRWVNSKFPEKEEKALRMLSDLAKESSIEILSIKSQPKVDFLDENSQKVQIEGRVCQKFIVTIEMKALYGDLVEYVNILKESLPAGITVERMSIRKDVSGMRQLSIILGLNLYLLS
ncbi:MAG: hypothetical protein KAR32_09965 [Candidatus Omnitrophica bacterium]|nr:hypothetical protein [Candidatus Omnitrophota bacterium]